MGQNASFTIVFSPEATVQEIDPSVEGLLGWDLEEASTAGLGLLHPSDRVAFGAMLKFVRSQPDADANLDVRFVSGDGGWASAAVSATNALSDAENPGLFVTAVLIDAPLVGGNDAVLPHSEPGDTEPADTEPGDTEPGDTELGDTELGEEVPVQDSLADIDTKVGEASFHEATHLRETITTNSPSLFDQDANDESCLAPSEPTDIGILLRLGSSIIDVVTGPVQGKLGCHPDSLAGLHLWEILHPDDETQFTEALDSMETKPDGEFLAYGPLRFLLGDGDECSFDTAIIRKPTGLIVRARDLRDSAARSVAVGDARLPESAVVFLDEHYNVTHASATFASLVGRQATSAVGMELLAAVHPTDRSYAEQRMLQPGLDGEIHGFLRVSMHRSPEHTEAQSQAWRWIEVIGRNYLDDPTVGQIALQLTVVDEAPDADAESGPPEPERLGTFTRDQDGNVSFINAVLLDMLGNVDALDFATERTSLVVVGDDGISETLEVDTGDGSIRYLRSRMTPIIGADGERTGDVAVVEDVTRLVESGDLPDRVVDGTEGSVLVLERGVGVKYLSADLAEFTNAEVSSDLHDLFTPKSAVLIRSAVWPAVLETGVWSGQLWLRSHEGSAVPFHAQFYNEPDLDAGQPLASVILTPLDSVPEWEHEDQLAVDPLTLLSSGAGLKRRAVRAIAKTIGGRSKVALAFIEIDRVNDLSPAGRRIDGEVELTAGESDALAVAIADRLTLACRHDESAARIDQRTFAVLSQRLGDSIDLEHLTARIVDELSPTFVVSPESSGESASLPRYLSVLFSLGLAHSCDGSLSADELFDNADLALERARRRGQVRTATVGENGQVEIAEQKSLEGDFRKALSADEMGSQLDNVYQVVLPSSDARLVASGDSSVAGRRFEALVRWHSPTRGIVGANEVVELANDLGLATAVGHRVLDRALDFLATTQRDHGVSVQVDVNVSELQVVERGFASRLDALLRLYDVEACQLGIEFSESAVIAADAALLSTIRQLQDLGVRLVVDDVTGRLFRAPIEGFAELKINRRLVEGVGRHAADTAQVAGILARAQERSLDVTAIGVATGRQLDLLTELGCSWFQGFLLGRPQSAADHRFSESLSYSETMNPTNATRSELPLRDGSTEDHHGVA